MTRRGRLKQLVGEATDLRCVGQFYTSNGISNEVAYVYASGVELSETHREPTELVEMRLVPISEVVRMAPEGEIADGPSVPALLSCEPPLDQDLHPDH